MKQKLSTPITMRSRFFSIAIASTFLCGVVAWYVARFLAFGKFNSGSIAAFVLAIALAVSTVRGDLSSKLLTFAISSGVAYTSFRLLFYMNSKDILLNSKEVSGEAFVFPGILFSLCSALLTGYFLAGYFRKSQINE